MGETRTTASTRRTGRTPIAAGAFVVSLMVLVGCTSTTDERAAIGDDPVAGSSTSSTSRPSATSSSGSPESSTSDASTTADTGSPTADPTTSADAPSTSDPGSTPSTSDTGSTPSTSTSTSPADPDASFTGNPDNLTLTAPGTELAYGAAALLPFSHPDAEGVFSINGLTVTKGAEADWTDLGVDPSDAQGEEPWYLRMTLTQESGGDFATTSVQDDLWAYGADGDVVSTVYPDDDTNSRCPLTYAPEGFAVGQSYDACVILSVNPGQTVDHIQFEGGYDADDPYFDNPVVWRG